MGALFFWNHFLKHSFSHKNQFFDQNWTQNAHILDFSRRLFRENGQKLKSVFGLRRRGRIAYEPILRSAPCDPKLKKNSDMFEVRTFLHQQYENVCKIASKRCPNVVVYFGGGASWATFGATISFLIRKMHPKCSKSDSEVSKMTPKVVPKCHKWLPNHQHLEHNRMCFETAL